MAFKSERNIKLDQAEFFAMGPLSRYEGLISLGEEGNISRDESVSKSSAEVGETSSSGEIIP